MSESAVVEFHRNKKLWVGAIVSLVVLIGALLVLFGGIGLFSGKNAEAKPPASSPVPAQSESYPTTDPKVFMYNLRPGVWEVNHQDVPGARYRIDWELPEGAQIEIVFADGHKVGPVAWNAALGNNAFGKRSPRGARFRATHPGKVRIMFWFAYPTK